jgi:hypothetical protein
MPWCVPLLAQAPSSKAAIATHVFRFMPHLPADTSIFARIGEFVLNRKC